MRKAATELGVANSSVHRSMKSLKKRAAAAGYSPEHDMTRPVPEGFSVSGVSSYYPATEEKPAQWVKSKADKTQRTIEKLQDIVAEIIEPITGIMKPVLPPEFVDYDLMCAYILADAHLGMYAWKEEAGEDWDTDLCSDTIRKTMAALVSSAPPAAVAVIFNLADYFHSDTNENKTLKSGHILDVDTRWGRVFQVGVKAYRHMIELALEKHEKVIVKSAKGNHDEHTGFVLAMLMQAYFENEPRVEIELPINPFTYHQFGNTLIGGNHGMIKPDKLPGIMACDMREIWGITRWHHWFVGHVHHKTVHEFAGCTVESFRSPSPKDNYTHSAGYRAERDMVMIKYHIEKGDIGRNIESIY
jgi:hypothetical protein